MAYRSEALPGAWKTKANVVGGREFVKPELVEETLRKGLLISFSIADPIYCAFHAGIVIAETHPFMDGNGRASRLLQDAILIIHGISPCLITKKARRAYIGALKNITVEGNPQRYLNICRKGIDLAAELGQLKKGPVEMGQLFSERKLFDEEQYDDV